jgi:hypothetical protein
MEEAVTLARVLRGLIRKSQPPSGHPDVLTKPMEDAFSVASTGTSSST